MATENGCHSLKEDGACRPTEAARTSRARELLFRALGPVASGRLSDPPPPRPRFLAQIFYPLADRCTPEGRLAVRWPDSVAQHTSKKTAEKQTIGNCSAPPLCRCTAPADRT